MVRLNLALAVGCLLVAATAAPIAFAQGSYQHHDWCLVGGHGKTCAYETLAQCQASKAGSGRCVRNTQTINPMHR